MAVRLGEHGQEGEGESGLVVCRSVESLPGFAVLSHKGTPEMQRRPASLGSPGP